MYRLRSDRNRGQPSSLPRSAGPRTNAYRTHTIFIPALRFPQGFYSYTSFFFFFFFFHLRRLI
jgi:hypothetical protein